MIKTHDMDDVRSCGWTRIDVFTLIEFVQWTSIVI